MDFDEPHGKFLAGINFLNLLCDTSLGQWISETSLAYEQRSKRVPDRSVAACDPDRSLMCQIAQNSIGQD